MVAKNKPRHAGHKRKNTHVRPPRLLAQRFAAPATLCNHCQGTGECPGCKGDRTEGCGECRAYRAGECSACNGQGDHS